MTTDLLTRARSGDQAAFAQLVDGHRRELEVHCYRMLGSLQDAEDALQETLLAAWQSLGGFEERASVRTWLYRIATNRCLNALRSASRRPRTEPPTLMVEPPEPTRLGEIVWLEPYPDVLLTDLPDTGPGPDARYETSESISLAFIAALQILPPRQRAVLVLRDVLGYPARDVAQMLETSEESVTSALKRARATMKREAPPVSSQPGDAELADRLRLAFEAGDVDGIVALLTEDAWVRMPPLPLEYQGRELAGRFFSTVAFREGRRYRLVPTGANGQPAFGVYLRDRNTGVGHAFGLLVLTVRSGQVSVITRFDNGVLGRFGLPRTLSD
jgi:RNA polymerase sigma-70 factor (ECF subfamily)